MPPSAVEIGDGLGMAGVDDGKIYFSHLPGLNPDGQEHTEQTLNDAEDKLTIGFEDLLIPQGDEDFDDLVVSIMGECEKKVLDKTKLDADIEIKDSDSAYLLGAWVRVSPLNLDEGDALWLPTQDEGLAVYVDDAGNVFCLKGDSYVDTGINVIGLGTSALKFFGKADPETYEKILECVQYSTELEQFVDGEVKTIEYHVLDSSKNWSNCGEFEFCIKCNNATDPLDDTNVIQAGMVEYGLSTDEPDGDPEDDIVEAQMIPAPVTGNVLLTVDHSTDKDGDGDHRSRARHSATRPTSIPTAIRSTWSRSCRMKPAMRRPMYRSTWSSSANTAR